MDRAAGAIASRTVAVFSYAAVKSRLSGETVAICSNGPHGS